MDRRSGPADGAGVPRDRPARGSLPELRFRLERLPAGHPSSPYDDRGARKPAPQQLRQLELPLADEERESESPAHASLLAATAGDHDGAVSRRRHGAGRDDEHGQSAGLVPAATPDREPSRSVAAQDETMPAPDWIASQNGAAQPDMSPARDNPPGSHVTIPYSGLAGAGDAPRGKGGRAGDSAAGAMGPPRRSGTDPYDSEPTGHELPAGNGMADSTDAFRGDWRGLDGAGTRNGHSRDHQGIGELDDPALPAGAAASQGAYKHGASQHDAAERGAAERSASQHDAAEHDSSQHGASQHDAAERSAGERSAGDQRIAEHDIAEHGIAQPAAAEHALPGHAPAEHRDRLTAEQEQIADQSLGRYRAADGRNVFGGYGESGLTPAIRRVEAHLPHGRIAPDSEQYTLKSPERYKEKLARMIARSPGVPAGDLAAEIYDAARYTFVFEPQDYTDGTWLVHRRLKAQGFELEARRNRWESPEYKGIRTRWRDPAHDLAFEVQFHTPASWDVLQRTHDAYLRITDPVTSTAERAQLRARQVAVAAGTRPPARCAEIGDFRADVR